MGTRTQEEYLLDFQDKLLDALKGQYESINRNFIAAYGLAALAALFKWGAVTKMDVLGIELAANGANILVVVPIAMSILYIIINYQLLIIGTIFKQIELNAKKLCELNEHAMPISIENVHMFSSGIAGLILSLSRWMANRLLTKNQIYYFDPVSNGGFLNTSKKIDELLTKITRWSIKTIIFAISAISEDRRAEFYRI